MKFYWNNTIEQREQMNEKITTWRSYGNHNTSQNWKIWLEWIELIWRVLAHPKNNTISILLVYFYFFILSPNKKMFAYVLSKVILKYEKISWDRDIGIRSHSGITWFFSYLLYTFMTMHRFYYWLYAWNNFDDYNQSWLQIEIPKRKTHPY